ncbi:MerR HTH family regulatory protein [Modicisalibacter ilicicola DSM 19980]|uniref:MerR HTH family regulatory protein n=1 Tax=Modicisalibacter ilicicola DSM 19980 TaxID=1121942 RepID=A0A1M5F5L8_9GAMM|nr:MerR HTH family regulatory protein [Halomonas ilicicola DSM 19980]
MKVGELAKRAGVTAETVRHYTREGLLQPRRDPENGYQLYGSDSLNRLRFIQRARTRVKLMSCVWREEERVAYPAD